MYGTVAFHFQVKVRFSFLRYTTLHHQSLSHNVRLFSTFVNELIRQAPVFQLKQHSKLHLTVCELQLVFMKIECNSPLFFFFSFLLKMAFNISKDFEYFARVHFFRCDAIWILWVPVSNDIFLKCWKKKIETHNLQLGVLLCSIITSDSN